MNRTRILVADDHSIVRRGVRSLLESHRGWEICGEASTAKDAISIAKRLHPDVAVLDITFSGSDQDSVSGLEATRLIRKASPNTRVLILSMHESEPMVREALEAGARGYVFKSDLDRDLESAIGQLIEGKTFFTSKVSDMLLGGFLEKGTDRSAKSGTTSGLLTRRQAEVLRLIAQGKTNKEVATALNLSAKTVETHRSMIMRKLKLESFSDLMRYAIREKLVEP